MDAADAVSSRRSVRAFLDRPVDRAVVRRVLDQAQMAPSGYNYQPWEGVVVDGEALQELSRLLKAMPAQEQEEFELVPPGLPQLYHDRREVNTAPRMEAAGVARGDMEGRARFNLRNYEFYGAPTSLLVFIPRVMGKPQWADVGMWLQTVMLLLVGEGLGSCPQETLYTHGKLIKQFVGKSDETHLLFCGLAIGHPDPDSPLNSYRRVRAPISEAIRFHGE